MERSTLSQAVPTSLEQLADALASFCNGCKSFGLIFGRFQREDEDLDLT